MFYSALCRDVTGAFYFLRLIDKEKNTGGKNTNESQKEEGQSKDNQDQHWQDCEGQGKNSKKDAGQLQEQPA